MKKQKELAMEIMEMAKEYAGWDFGVFQKDGIWYVGCTLHDHKGMEIEVSYLIAENGVELTVLSENCRYDDCIVNDKLNAIPLEYPVYAMTQGNILSINTPLSAEMADKLMKTIVARRMPDMFWAMAFIIGFGC